MRTGADPQANAKAGLVVAVILALCLGSSAARSQTSKDAAPHPRLGSTSGVTWHDCARAEASQAPAIEAARRLLAQSWLVSRETLFAAYTMPGEKRSPFDLSAREPNTGPRDGFVEARAPRCLFATPEVGGATYRVRFIAPFYRFYELEQGWSPPLRNGLMLEATASRADTGWKVDAPPSEQTILMPDQKPRSAKADHLPPDAAWSEPIPGCGKRQRWNGQDCVARKR